MKKLETKEGIAVVVALCVVLGFFVFGSGLLSLFSTKKTDQTMSTTEDRGLLKQDRVVGTGDEAVASNIVTVHYVGHFVDGKVFDSSIARGEPLKFVLGSGQVIEGWDKGIVGMRVGGTRLLSVPPEMGYGMNDYGPIPGASTLIFEVQLLKVEK